MTQFDLDIEDILRERYPRLSWIKAFDSISMSGASMATGNDHPTAGASPWAEELAEARAFEAQCRALPPQEVAQLAAASRPILKRRADEESEKRRLQVEAEKAKAEGQRFFNQPTAVADFGLWCKAPYWTADEAAALLLGRDPRRVNPSTLAEELSKTTGLFGGTRPTRSKFHDDFDGLRIFLSRAVELAGSRLTPDFVVSWAEQTGTPIPPTLARSLVAPRALHLSIEPDTAGTLVKWTDERKEALRAFRKAHGTKAAALEFGISQQRIRQLLPEESAKPSKLEPHNVFARPGRAPKRRGRS
jgi:hypothetical protein